jgi:hypothetical protein
MQRVISAGARLAPYFAASSVLLGIATTLQVLPRSEALTAGIATLSAFTLATLAHAAQSVDQTRLANAVDRALGLKGRIANAWSLRSEASAFAELTRADAEAHAVRIVPTSISPLRWPFREAVIPLVLMALASFLISRPTAPAAHRAQTTTSLTPVASSTLATLDNDALDALRDRMASVPRAETEAVQAETEALNALIEEIAAGHLESRAALDELLVREEAVARALREAQERTATIQAELAEAARAMRPLASTDALRDALMQGELAQAQASLRARAEAGAAPSEAEIENLRALAEDRERAAREAALAEAEQEEERLLQRQREQGSAQSPEEERLLQRRQRELETLRREHEQRQAAERELDRLRRELDEAADAMERNSQARNDQGHNSEAGEALERAAEELNRQAREQQSAESLEQLQREIERLREALQEAQRQRQEGRDEEGRGGQGQQSEDAQGEGQGARMRRFVMRAQGEGEGEEGGMRIGMRRPGSSGSGREGGEGTEQGSQGQSPQPGSEGSPSGDDGEGASGRGQQAGDREGEGNVFVLGEQGNAQLEIPGMRGSPGGQGAASRGAEGNGNGSGQGSGHAPETLDEASARLGQSTATRVGSAPGAGPSRSEVIRGGAAQGFATRDYERVYGDYASHAEESLEHDRVPPGYRTYVERYFDLIRPRTDAPPPSSP